MKILSSAEMKLAEQSAIQNGISEIRLMSNAGDGAFVKICDTVGNTLSQSECVVLCGSGNNGGDGFVVARRLAEKAKRVTAVLMNSLPKTPCAEAMYSLCKETKCDILDLDFDKPTVLTRLLSAKIVVDAVFGTGFHDSLPQKAQEIFQIVNEGSAKVFALDLPSGVNADTGELSENTVCADCTIAFGSLKLGHVLKPSSEVFGKLCVVAIGIPENAYSAMPDAVESVDMKYLKSVLPKILPHANKGDNGRVLNIAGSSSMSGAAALSTMGILRSGTGLCTLASVKEVINRVASSIYEPTLMPLLENQWGQISAENRGYLAKNLEKYSAVCIGMGLGISEDTRQIVKTVLKNADCPVILDADGLNLIASDINILKDTKANVIITPHPGEMSRLIGRTAAEINENRLEAARSFARKYGVTVVLKGRFTVISSPSGKSFINLSGNAGLAKGGSGDILSGIISSFAAQGAAPEIAAAAGVYLHGLAADKAAAHSSMRGMLPSDVLSMLPKILKEAE